MNVIFRENLCGRSRGPARVQGEGREELPGDSAQLYDQPQGLRLPEQLQRRVDIRGGPGEWLHTHPVDQKVNSTLQCTVTHCYLVVTWKTQLRFGRHPSVFKKFLNMWFEWWNHTHLFLYTCTHGRLSYLSCGLW